MNKKPLIFNDENEKILENAFNKSKMFNVFLWTKFYKLLKAVVPTLILYSILVWVFLNIYYIRGFEEAVIIVLVGVLIRAGKSNK